MEPHTCYMGIYVGNELEGPYKIGIILQMLWRDWVSRYLDQEWMWSLTAGLLVANWQQKCQQVTEWLLWVPFVKINGRVLQSFLVCGGEKWRRVFLGLKKVRYYCGMFAESQQRQPLLGNGSADTPAARHMLSSRHMMAAKDTDNTWVIVGSGVFCAVRTDDQLPLRESLDTAVRRVGGWCEMAATLW
jgi:hypothetical protein